MIFPHGRPITVVRGGGYSRGDRLPPTSAHVIEGCGWGSRGFTTEAQAIDQRARTGVIQGVQLYYPAGADLLHTDQVILGQRLTLGTLGDAVLWEIEGEPGEWNSPLTGTVFPSEVSLRRAAG